MKTFKTQPKDLMDGEVMQYVIDSHAADPMVMEMLKRWNDCIALALSLEGELIEAGLKADGFLDHLQPARENEK